MAFSQKRIAKINDDTFMLRIALSRGFMNVEFIDENEVSRLDGVQFFFYKIMTLACNQIVDFIGSVIMVISFKGLGAMNAMVVKFPFFPVGYGVGIAGYHNLPRFVSFHS